ncbi:MAG: hypothetical protein ACD_40C00144G0001 [uncultured bacterium]|nr:MAG: hypothetical protein ACD_40C00144G0001 [uncultured bacterium]
MPTWSDLANQCSPGRARTYDLDLTVPLLLPKGLDYLISHLIGTRVYSLYTFNLAKARNLARDCPDGDKVIISGFPRISPIFTQTLLDEAAI